MYILLEHVVAAVVILFVVFQVVLPALLNKPLVPLFRWWSKQAELDAVLYEEEEARLTEQIALHKHRLKESECDPQVSVSQKSSDSESSSS